jgi:hypothetical protein
MARTVSWLPRLPALLHSVQDSVRSHYTAREIEQLFEIQPRSAQMLLGLLPTVRIGRTLLVEREILAGFLARLAEAEDANQQLRALRAAPKPPAVRRKLRDLVRRDTDSSSLPPNIEMEKGKLTIQFQNIEELSQSLWRLAQILEEDLEGFADHYEPEADTPLQPDSEEEMEEQDAQWIAQWLKEHE